MQGGSFKSVGVASNRFQITEGVASNRFHLPGVASNRFQITGEVIMGAGQLTQKPTHPQKKWSTHPNSWITHPSFLDNSPKFQLTHVFWTTHPNFWTTHPNSFLHKNT